MHLQLPSLRLPALPPLLPLLPPARGKHGISHLGRATRLKRPQLAMISTPPSPAGQKYDQQLRA